jgi:hypothetical protein
LDFFSWHCYTDDPGELGRRARAIRALLDSFGFTKTESHLNEWNYLPNNSWTPLSRKAAPEDRQRAYDEISGARGAAFVAAALIEFQDAPVDVCNLYHADVGAFGLFTEQGVPTKNFFALRAFRELLNTPKRVAVSATAETKLAAIAGHDDGRHAQVLVANSSGEAMEIVLREDQSNEAVVRLIDAQHSFEPISTNDFHESFTFTIPGTSVALVTLRQRGVR